MKQTMVHFFVLIAILTIGVLTFITAVAYVLWGFIHHAMRKDLHQKIVVEYLLIGAIAIVLLVTMLGF